MVINSNLILTKVAEFCQAVQQGLDKISALLFFYGIISYQYTPSKKIRVKGKQA
jgi:hypothetical protein